MSVIFCSEEQVILSLIHSGSHPRNWYIVSTPIAITAEKKSLRTTYVLKMLKPGNTCSLCLYVSKLLSLCIWQFVDQLPSHLGWLLVSPVVHLGLAQCHASLWKTRGTAHLCRATCLCNCCPYWREPTACPLLLCPWPCLGLCSRSWQDNVLVILMGVQPLGRGCSALRRFRTDLLMTAGELHAQRTVTIGNQVWMPHIAFWGHGIFQLFTFS